MDAHEVSEWGAVRVEVVVVGGKLDVEHGVGEHHRIRFVAESFAKERSDYIPFLSSVSVERYK